MACLTRTPSKSLSRSFEKFRTPNIKQAIVSKTSNNRLNSNSSPFSHKNLSSSLVLKLESPRSNPSSVIMGSKSKDSTESTIQIANEDLDSETHRKELYPPIQPNITGMLKVSEVHTLYWEESGNPEGNPILFVHGGPGAGTDASNRQFFDPSFYRIILFDQRGSGKSIPHASLEENTTWDLVEDMEKIRNHLNIYKWIVFGGSWGSTLSLSYAITYPDNVLGLILRGIFLLRKKEIQFFYQEGTSFIYPEAFDEYVSIIPEKERNDLVSAYNKLLMDDSKPKTQLKAALSWTKWEMSTNCLFTSQKSISRGLDEQFALAFARVENHYFFHSGFFESDNFLLENVNKIENIPTVIVQGRYDMVCPIISAWDLHKALPKSEFKVVPDAGHSANEVGISHQLVMACEKFKSIFL